MLDFVLFYCKILLQVKSLKVMSGKGQKETATMKKSQHDKKWVNAFNKRKARAAEFTKRKRDQGVPKRLSCEDVIAIANRRGEFRVNKYKWSQDYLRQKIKKMAKKDFWPIKFSHRCGDEYVYIPVRENDNG